VSDKLKVFISSSQKEFAHERFIIELALQPIPFIEVVRLEDSASPLPIQQRSLAEVRECAIFIGLIGAEPSELTEEEFNEAKEFGKPRFVYLSKAVKENPRYVQFVKGQVEREVSRYSFANDKDLSERVVSDIQQYLNQVLWLGVEQWRSVSREGGTELVDTRIDQQIAHVAATIDRKATLLLRRPLVSEIVLALREEVKKGKFFDSDPLRVLILRRLLDGPELRRNLTTPYFDLSTPMRLYEMKKSGRIAASKSKGRVVFNITDLGVLDLAAWLGKSGRSERARELLAQINRAGPGLDEFLEGS
jgi:hypothetical protein